MQVNENHIIVLLTSIYYGQQWANQSSVTSRICHEGIRWAWLSNFSHHWTPFVVPPRVNLCIMKIIVTGFFKSFNYKFHILILLLYSYICDGVDSKFPMSLLYFMLFEIIFQIQLQYFF